MSSPGTLWVCAAVLIEDGYVMLTQRHASSAHPGAWEFPGGKIEHGEDPRAALRREMLEELDLEVRVGDVLELTFQVRQSGPLALLFFAVERAPNARPPRPLDVAAIRWSPLDALPLDEMTPADRVMGERLAAS